jgi:hypothetical protein
MDLREFPSVLPLHFFQVELIFSKDAKPKLIEDYAQFLGEDPFSQVRLSFSEKGIHIDLKVDKSFEKAVFPDVEKGDGFELLVDTRGIPDSQIIHKYCHHFVFLPKEVDGISGVEVTSFKTNDKRDLASKELLKASSSFTKNGYAMQIFIPDNALFGYDLVESPHLKLAYIVHLGSRSHPNHFPKSNLDYNLKDHPSLWADIKVI